MIKRSTDEWIFTNKKKINTGYQQKELWANHHVYVLYLFVDFEHVVSVCQIIVQSQHNKVRERSAC